MLEALTSVSTSAPPPSFADHRAALALLEAMLPGGERVPAADETTLARTDDLLATISPTMLAFFRKAQRALSAAAIASTGRPFYALSAREQQDLLVRWAKHPVLRGPYSLLLLAYKMVHFDRPHVNERLGGRFDVVRELEQPRWLQQIKTGEELDPNETIDCDVVVVGTGAGGAVVGRELAERGYAVAFVEEGDHYRRDAFDGRSIDAYRRFYRAGLIVGNAPIPVFMGRLVGGSTAINGGTCFRTPPWVLDRWCETMRTDDFTPSAMAPYFERVESFLEVAPTDERYLGPIGGVFARGCGKLGWRYRRISRNTPGCQASGFCDYGCRTDARRSTNISYIPAALSRSAMLFTRLRAERVRIENGRATGLQAVTRSGATIRFNARAVVFSGGALPTPRFLQQQGLGGRSGQLGRNLSVHPSAGMSGLFDEDIAPGTSVPQGYFVEEFLRDGILIISALSPPNTSPMALALSGRPLMAAMDQHEHIATIGPLIADEAKGILRAQAAGQYLIQSNLTKQDVSRLHVGMVKSAELLLAAGAKRLYPSVTSMPELEPGDLHRFAKAKIAAGDLALISYHPLGTCRMGRDRRTSVVDLDHQLHEVSRLFIVDGSTVQGPLGVNPQLTIMAMATRAAERIADLIG